MGIIINTDTDMEISMDTDTENTMRKIARIIVTGTDMVIKINTDTDMDKNTVMGMDMDTEKLMIKKIKKVLIVILLIQVV